METLLQLDLSALHLINTKVAHPWLDDLMRFWSAEWPWLLLLAWFVGLAVKGRLWNRIGQVAWIALTIGSSDIIAAYLVKPWVGRLRPCRIDNLVRIVDACSGMYGFPSNHATNAAVFASMWYFMRGPRQAGVAIGCGFMVGLSRVYLGVHYPSDILAGFAFGACFGCISFFLGSFILAALRERYRSSSR